MECISVGTEPSSLAPPTLNYACGMLRAAQVLLSSAYGSAHLSYQSGSMLVSIIMPKYLLMKNE